MYVYTVNQEWAPKECFQQIRCISQCMCLYMYINIYVEGILWVIPTWCIHHRGKRGNDAWMHIHMNASCHTCGQVMPTWCLNDSLSWVSCEDVWMYIDMCIHIAHISLPRTNPLGNMCLVDFGGVVFSVGTVMNFYRHVKTLSWHVYTYRPHVHTHGRTHTHTNLGA